MNHFISFLTAFILCYGLSAQKIYITKNACQADLKVFVVDKEYQADLKAYKVDQAYKAKGNYGLWYFTKNNYQADLTVYFVDYTYPCGWKNEEQKHLLY